MDGSNRTTFTMFCFYCDLGLQLALLHCSSLHFTSLHVTSLHSGLTRKGPLGNICDRLTLLHGLSREIVLEATVVWEGFGPWRIQLLYCSKSVVMWILQGGWWLHQRNVLPWISPTYDSVNNSRYNSLIHTYRKTCHNPTSGYSTATLSQSSFLTRATSRYCWTHTWFTSLNSN